MLRRTVTPRLQPLPSLWKRIATTVVVATVGAVAGLLYSKFFLSIGDEAGRLDGMYGTLGAVIAVLSVRVAAVVRTILTDYFGDS